jgi:CheY-like chemotaxis protein
MRGAVAVLRDGSGLERADEQELRHLSDEFPNLPLVVLLNYPRVETIQRAEQCGATTVLSKPYLVADLLTAIAEPAYATPVG